jgi:hypothetical protein
MKFDGEETMTAVKKLLLCCLLLALVWSLSALVREDADRIGFGNVYVGGHYNRTFTWTNSNSFPVTFFQITLTGNRAFSISEVPELPLVCAPGESFSYQINFDPVYAGAQYCQTNHTTDFPGQQRWSSYHSGTAYWPMIHRLPYYEDCSTEFADDLPAGWSKIASDTYNAQVGLFEVDYYYQQLVLNNGHTTSSQHNFLLITPFIADSLDLSRMRMKLRVQSSPANLPLILGTMTDPADLSSFVPCDTLVTGTNWDEFVIELAVFQTGGRYLAFRHPVTASYQNFFLDDITIEYIPANDLSVLSLSGDYNQAAMSEALVYAEILNRGTEPQANYRVILEDYNGNTLGVSPGVLIAPGQRIMVPLIWQPYEALGYRLRGNLENPGDQNPLNNKSPEFRMLISPGYADLRTIGDGSMEARVPMDTYYEYHIFETIYYPAEIGRTGQIYAIRFFKTFGSTSSRSYNVFVGETPQTDLSSGWIPSTLLSPVYSGPIGFSNETSYVTITFQNPYIYNGGNLVVMISSFGYSVPGGYFNNFKCQISGSSRSRWATRNSPAAYNPAGPPMPSTLSNIYPMTTLFFSGHQDYQGVSVFPHSAEFGDQPVDSQQSLVFSLINQSNSPITVTNLALRGDDAFSVLEETALPRTLQIGQRLLFSLKYAPLALGDHSAILSISDDTGRQIYSFPVSGRASPQEVTELPLTLGFDHTYQDDVPQGWLKYVQTNANSRIIRSGENPHSKPSCLLFANGNDMYPQLLIAAPPLAPNIDINSLRLKFWARSNLQSSFQIGFASDPTIASDFLLISDIPISTDWSIYSVDLNSYPPDAQGRRLVIRYPGGASAIALYLDDLRLEYKPQRDLELIHLSGNSSPSLDHSSTCRVRIRNWGELSAQSFTVRLLDENGTIINQQSYGNLPAGSSQDYLLNWQSPVVIASLRAELVFPGDENLSNNLSAPMPLDFCDDGEALSFGEGYIPANVPLDYSKNASIYQCILTRNQLYDFYGMIHGLALDYRFNLQVPSRAIKIWLGRTSLTDLSQGWIPISEQELVFSDSLGIIPPGEHELSLIFPDSFDFRYGDNLVLTFLRPNDNINHGLYKDFYCHRDSSARHLFFSSETGGIDPVYPPLGNLTDLLPNIRFLISTGGTGSLTCTVQDPSGMPVADVAVVLAGSVYSTETDANGSFGYAHLPPGDYQIQLSKFAYQPLQHDITVTVDQNTDLLLTIHPYPQVSIFGRIFGSDTGALLPNASVYLSGYQDYFAASSPEGLFQITGVYGTMPYNYIILAEGYQTRMGTWFPGSTDLYLGDIFLYENAYPPNNAQASLVDETILLSWDMPNTSPVGLQESFESEVFPPPGWSRIINNNEGVQPSGLMPTWCRSGSVNPGLQPAIPPHGSYQAGLGWAGSHQDEWLITPPFNCPAESYLSFQSYVFQGSTAGDHYYVKVSNDNAATWTIIWDAATQTGGWNYYQTTVQIDLAIYSGQEIKIAFHAEDPITEDGLWYVWLIDNVYVGNVLRKTDDRALVSWKIHRLIQGTENSPENWSLLEELPLDELSFVDTAWQELPAGDFRWAIQAVYQANVISEPVFSNVISKLIHSGMISGVVRQTTLQPIPGATVSAGSISATTNNSGAYTLILPAGTYSVTAQATDFQSQTIENVIVYEDQTTTANFKLTPGSEAWLDTPPAKTDLIGCAPNPFNPQTTIRYSLRDHSTMRLYIYNQRGQVVRRMVDQEQPSGYYSIIWDGKDSSGRSCGSGLYLIRMESGSFSKIVKAILLK